MEALKEKTLIEISEEIREGRLESSQELTVFLIDRLLKENELEKINEEILVEVFLVTCGEYRQFLEFEKETLGKK